MYAFVWTLVWVYGIIGVLFVAIALALLIFMMMAVPSTGLLDTLWSIVCLAALPVLVGLLWLPALVLFALTTAPWDTAQRYEFG